MIKYCVGLGNPGAEYRFTRHNVGFMVVDKVAELFITRWTMKKKFLAEVAEIKNGFLLKPQTFMNDSGKAVRAMMEYYEKDIHFTAETAFQNLLVVHDDLDIEVGKFKIQFGTGPKIHNGLNSMYEHLGTDQFWHVRMGVDGRQGSRLISSHDYVLSPFVGEEANSIHTVIDTVVKELESRLQSV